jgi:formylglycine-generating enzyme required for sulfatase activity
MSGNVWEWCHDSYDAGYYGKSPASDPTGASSGGLRILRGGSWYDLPRLCRSSNRSRLTPDNAGNDLGLRVVAAEPKPAEEVVKVAGLVAGQNLVVADLGMEMIYVEPGSFQMGSNSGDSAEEPVHAVRIGRAFWMDKYEVTQSQYETITGRNPSSFKGLSLPVEGVSWNDGVAFCRMLTERERKAGRLPLGYVYRLPTEAEWEYAARGGSKGRGFEYAGSGNLDEVAWHSGNSGFKTHPVGGQKPNELGLYDMSGNVWEWCHDSYDAGYYAKSPSSDPTGASSGGLRVLRGGSWNYNPWLCRSSTRYGTSPGSTDYNIGFRVVASWPLD